MKTFMYLFFGVFAALAMNTVLANELASNDNGVAVELVMLSPSTIKVSFDEVITLDSVVIKGDDGYQFNLDDQIPQKQGQVFAFEVPKLLPANYIVLWRAKRIDNSLQIGDLKLVIEDADVYPRPSTKKQTYGILHKKLHQ